MNLIFLYYTWFPRQSNAWLPEEARVRACPQQKECPCVEIDALGNVYIYILVPSPHFAEADNVRVQKVNSMERGKKVTSKK